MKKIILIALSFISIKGLHAQAKDSLKENRYSLFHPVPKALMREMSTDRPDVTESAYTLDAGHFQLETDLVKRTTTKNAAEKITEDVINAINLKLGISRTVDVQAVIESYKIIRTKASGNTFKESGVGDLTLRVKKNIFGDDSGNNALAILPFVNIPLHNNEEVSGGVVLPFAFALGHGWDAGTQVEANFGKNQVTKKLNTAVLSSFTVGHDLSEKFSFFVEAVATYDCNAKYSEFFLNGGPIFMINKNIKLDAGLYYGVKKESSNAYFLGFSFRR